MQAIRVDNCGKMPQSNADDDEKLSAPEKHLEHVDTMENLVYDDAEQEPELHFRTWVALAAMWLYNFVIVFALLSPAAVVSNTQPGSMTTYLPGYRYHISEQASTPRTSKPGY